MSYKMLPELKAVLSFVDDMYGDAEALLNLEHAIEHGPMSLTRRQYAQAAIELAMVLEELESSDGMDETIDFKELHRLLSFWATYTFWHEDATEHGRFV